MNFDWKTLNSAFRFTLVRIMWGLLLAGCGGAEPELGGVYAGKALPGETRAPIQQLVASDSTLLSKPIPVGATRVFQLVSYSPNTTSFRGTTYFRAEEILSQFDAMHIPINVVACENYGGAGGGFDVVFAIVLDVRDEDLGMAITFGFAELTEQFLSFGLFSDHACSFGMPSISAEQRIHGFARRVYPQWFGSEITPFGIYEQFRYRYYVGPDNYLGLAGDDVYVHNGRDWDFLFVGKIKDFIPYIEGIPGTVKFYSRPRHRE